MKPLNFLSTTMANNGQAADLKQLRENLLNTLLSVAVVISAILYISAISPLVNHPAPPLYFLIYTSTFLSLIAIKYHKKLSSYRIRAGSLLALLYILGTYDLFIGGMRAGAALFLLTFIAIYTLLHGIKGGATALVVTLFTLVLTGLGVFMTVIKPSLSFSPTEIVPWGVSTIAIMLMGSLLVISIAGLIDNLNTNLKRATLLAKELELAYDETIKGWSRMLELRDNETQGHTIRAAEMTVLLAKELQVNEDELTHIHRGVLLHDIGKMGIPDSILLNPNRLTEEERKIVQKHPAYANETLSPIKYLERALDIPHYHHEKWDGTGYPAGLKGEQIPLSARIFAIIDVWDALTSPRPYHEAWSKEKAVEYIKDNSAIHFDPKIVEAFLKMLEEGKLKV